MSKPIPHGYVDFVKEVEKVGGPFAFVRQHRHFTKCSQYGKKATGRTPQQIVDEVLKSERVKEAVQEYCDRYKTTKEKANEKCNEIMNQMAHAFNLDNIRKIGYFITKVLTMVFDEILVNMKELRKIREVFKDTPVIFIPTHRTYIDFLLLSVLCFDQEVPLPAIAAAMDFMNSKFIGEVLRQCGAFFIKRAVGEDILYWAIFTEYVQTHIINGDRPVEFFIEGTRSRTNKSLPPKYGLLQILLEPYLRGKVYDMVVVPISMNYDKILEEQLYAYELLGFPKPKESTSGLLKARSILSKNFGRVFVTVCPPISIREHLGVSIRRNAFVCQPDSQWKMSDMEKKRIRTFGHNIIQIHHDHSIVSIWSIASSAILNLLSVSQDKSMRVGQILNGVHDILNVMEKLGLFVHIRHSLEKDLSDAFELHNDLYTLNGPIDNPQTELCLAELPVDGKSSNIPKKILAQAVVQIILTNHANSSLHLLAAPSILSMAILRANNMKDGAILFSWIRSLLYREFVYDSGTDQFQELIEKFVEARLINVDNDKITINDISAVTLLTTFTESYLRILSIMINVVLNAHPLMITQQEAVTEAQKNIMELQELDPSMRLSFLSADTLKNAFTTLQVEKCVIKQAKNFKIDLNRLKTLQGRVSVLLNKRSKL